MKQATVPKNPKGSYGSSAQPRKGQVKQRRNGPRRPANTRLVQGELVKTVCGITDPFCPAARGALRPDGVGGVRLPFQFRNLINFDTSATQQLVAFNPAMGSQYNFAPVAASVFTLPAGWQKLTNNDTIAGYGTQYRVVSAGVCIRSIGAVNTTQGTVIFTEQEGGFPTVPVAVTPGSLNGARVYTRNITPGMEVCWISSPEGPLAHEFRPVSTAASPVAFAGWSGLMVQTFGALISATPQLSAEFVINIELLVTQDNLMAQFTPPPPRPMPMVTVLADKIRARVEAFLDAGVEKAGEAIERYAAEALRGRLKDSVRAQLLLGA